MATEIISPKEVILNSVNYPLVGKIKPQLTSVFPEKQVVGDYTLVSDPYVDTWILSDQRGGILIEEMSEKEHANRCYWSTANIDFKGHIILPSLATDCGSGGLSSKDGYVLFEYDGVVYVSLDEYLRSFDNTNDDFNDAVATLAANPTDAKEMVRTMFVACDDSGYYYNPKLWFPQQLTDGGLEIWTSATELTNWTEDGTGTLTIEYTTITEGGAAAKFVVTGGNYNRVYQAPTFNWDWRGKQVTVTAQIHSTIAGAASKVGIEIDDVATQTTAEPVGTGAYELVTCAHTINAAATQLLIKVGAYGTHASARTVYVDDVKLSYTETTSPWITKSAIPAKYLVEWDSKQFKINGENTLSYATDNVTWTDNGKIPIDDDSVTRLYIDKDADGDDIIYAATTQGIWAHDFANAKWTLTQLQTPDHPNSGRGATVWRDAAYISAGLDVLKYEVDTPARITSVGLANDDGLPSEQDGEIMMLVSGYNEMYACLDASQATGTGYSSLMAYDGSGWRVKWESVTADKAFKCALVTAAYSEYRIFWATDNKVYHMNLNRSLRNPLKISGSTFDTGATHITPWFDADWQVGNKLALRFKVNVLGDVSADEDVVVRYRTDHATSAIASTNFTTLGTIETSGLTTYNFASSVGLAFKSIQFRFDLARKGADTDETPDIQYAVLEYVKVIPKRWGWRFTVDCSQDWHGRTSKQLIDALITAAELETLVTLVYDTTTLYVQIKSVTGERETGRTRKGQFEVFCTELF